MKDPTLNQTQFSQEKPLFEQRVESKPEAMPPASDLVENPRPRRSLIFVIGGIVLVVLIAALLILAIIFRSAEPEQISEELIETMQTESSSPLQLRLNELKAELRTADPNQEELPFPPINRQLLIEPLRQ